MSAGQDNDGTNFGKGANNGKDAEPATTRSSKQNEILWKTYKRPYRHLDDLLAAKPDVPSGASILGLLHLAEFSIKQADTFLDNLERPDLALEKWVTVNIIMEGIIPYHDGYSSLMGDLGLLTRFNTIKKWLMEKQTQFDEAKEFIRNDNYRNGVKSFLTPVMNWPDEDSRAISGDHEGMQRRNIDSNDSVMIGTASELASKGFISPKNLTEDSVDTVDSQSALKRFLDDFTVSYPCHMRTCPDHQSGFSSQELLVHHYELVHGESYYLCDYPSCQSQTGSAIMSGSKIRFLRCDFRGSEQDYRQHLRDFHKEDINMLESKLSNIEPSELNGSRLQADWWRCHKCLRRVIIQNEGYTCKDCKAICEPIRITARQIRFGYRSSIRSEDIIYSNGVTVLPETPMHNRHPDSSNVYHLPPISALSPEDSILEPYIIDTPSGNCNIRQETLLGSMKSESSEHITIEYTHTEYTSHKHVPLKTIRQLGYGSLGIVDAVRLDDSEDGALVARKIIRLPNLSRKKLLPLIHQEVAVLRGLSHQHIVQVISTYETTKAPRQFGILISPAGDEDLSHFLERVSESDFPEEDIKLLNGWQCCLASALAYVHSQNIRHKDIKPNNIICKGDQIYLTDFGSAHQFSAGVTSSTDGPLVGITKMYSAPEVIADDRRGRPADIYSLGCVFAEMATVANGERIDDFHEYRSQPIPDEPDRMAYIYHATAHLIEPWFTELGDSWTASLLHDMLAVDQKCRPTATALHKTLLTQYGPSNCPCHLQPFSGTLPQLDDTAPMEHAINSGITSNSRIIPKFTNKTYAFVDPK
ncbi:ce465734-bef3-400c-882c-6c393666cd6e [Sclerotinia trifoliorum]|uniref:non-specific serine/threonine protein kinase n=1 Tax=Sclerotinia trifoliorum TaxID=28548 RepID=A0A8H2W470_9HELO|nr:ce465734-bef3-400c-882c-6c393666cd6e [Sclerotinia trifoliorum]